MPANSACSASGEVASSPRSRERSACSVSAWELTETYSPAAIERAPATRPATAASKTADWVGSAEATPTTKLLVEMRPSLAPSVEARNQPIRSLRCNSPCMADLCLGTNRMPPNQNSTTGWTGLRKTATPDPARWAPDPGRPTIQDPGVGHGG